MTTWQDQQPMSRRALRESERAHAQAMLADTGEQPPVEITFDQQIFDNPLSGPRSEFPQQAPQNSPQSSDLLRRQRQSGSMRAESDTPPYRLKDFSPESRGSSFSSTQSAPWTPPSPGSEDLIYQTSVEANRPAPEVFSAPVVTPPVVVTPEELIEPRVAPDEHRSNESMEHTLTRRELREMRSTSAQSETVSVLPEAVLPEAVLPEAVLPETVLPEAVLPEAVLPEAVLPEAVLPEVASPAPPHDEPSAAMAEFDKIYRANEEVPPVVEPMSTPRDVVSTPPIVEPVTAGVSPPRPAPIAEPMREVVTAPEVFTAPVNHWSHQAAIDDQVEMSVGAHRRDLSSSDAITTSALVLPNFPISSPITGPVSGTGEILMTGSISLPRSLGVNGSHPSRYDRSDIDSIIDAGDREDSAPDSAPVRAVRAVSTYTSPQGILSTKRPKGNNLPMVLSITAGVMMVGVVVLVVVGMIFKIF